MFMRNLLMATEIEAKAARYTRAMRMYVDHGTIADLRRQLLVVEAKESKLDVTIPAMCKTVCDTAEKMTGRRAAGAKAEKEAAAKNGDQTPVPAPKSKRDIVKESQFYTTVRMAMENVVHTSSSEMWDRVIDYVEFYATRDSDERILTTIAALLARGSALNNIRP